MYVQITTNIFFLLAQARFSPPRSTADVTAQNKKAFLAAHSLVLRVAPPPPVPQRPWGKSGLSRRAWLLLKTLHLTYYMPSLFPSGVISNEIKPRRTWGHTTTRARRESRDAHDLTSSIYPLPAQTPAPPPHPTACRGELALLYRCLSRRSPSVAQKKKEIAREKQYTTQRTPGTTPSSRTLQKALWNPQFYVVLPPIEDHL